MMKQKFIMAVAACALGLIISAQANVGDTLAESNQRYGECLPWEGIPAKDVQDMLSRGYLIGCEWIWQDRKGGIIVESFNKDHVHCNLIQYRSTEPISIDEAQRLIVLNLGTQVTWREEHERIGWSGYMWYGNIGLATCSVMLDYVYTGGAREGYCLIIAMSQ
jgi:hypothetical protein